MVMYFDSKNNVLNFFNIKKKLFYFSGVNYVLSFDIYEKLKRYL